MSDTAPFKLKIRMPSWQLGTVIFPDWRQSKSSKASYSKGKLQPCVFGVDMKEWKMEISEMSCARRFACSNVTAWWTINLMSPTHAVVCMGELMLNTGFFATQRCCTDAGIKRSLTGPPPPPIVAGAPGIRNRGLSKEIWWQETRC